MHNLLTLTKILGQLFLTFTIIIVVTFVVVRILPGNPAIVYLGERASQTDIARINAELGLNEPIPQQLAMFFGDMLSGDLGSSIHLRVPVTDLILQRLPVTLLLTLIAGILALSLAFPLALVAALRPHGLVDTAVRGAFQIGLSVPVFFLGLLLLNTLGATLHWFPVGGYAYSFPDNLYHLFLPALNVALAVSAVLMRNLRSAIMEVTSAEYVVFARAKGLSKSTILFKYVLRNALISTVTLFGFSISALLGGAVISETIFAIPGVGRLMLDSVYGRDYPVVQGLTLLFAAIVSIVFLATDIVHAALDPRARR